MMADRPRRNSPRVEDCPYPDKSDRRAVTGGPGTSAAACREGGMTLFAEIGSILLAAMLAGPTANAIAA
jgi:hypothetical protein